jgi:uncharacterized repeat protein (TIGR03803 family)
MRGSCFPLEWGFTAFTSMKTQIATRHNDRRTSVQKRSEPLLGVKPVLVLLTRLLWAATLVLPAFVAQAGVVFTTLYSFDGGNDGGYPDAGLVQGSDGAFYGTTYGGGANGSGTVFKISTNGVLTSLYSFTGASDGAGPDAGLVLGTDGNFYGTTENGGSNGGYGTVFKISTNGTLTSLYSFTGGNDGAYPLVQLVEGSDGSFYGTTSVSDASSGTGSGTVFKISTNGVLTSLYSFTGGNDGWDPRGLVQGSDGYFYGTTYEGGSNGGFGTVFKISTNGTLTSLYSFTGGNNGAYPMAGLVQGGDGSFYGTTSGSYASFGSGNGTVFKISANGTLTSLYSFTGGNDGANRFAGLVQGSDSNFYGTTANGGANGEGVVFEISAIGTLTSLYSFTGGSDGANPTGALVQGSDGSFYGTTYGTSTGGAGTVFRLAIVPTAPAFQAVTLTNSMLLLTWSTVLGGTYLLQFNSDLSSNNWTNLGSPLTATGTTLSQTDPVTNVPQRFYRLVISE